jgi:hypothetical protein
VGSGGAGRRGWHDRRTQPQRVDRSGGAGRAGGGSAGPRGGESVLVIDWPSRDVPASLTFAGFTVIVKGGPGAADYAAWELGSGEPVSRQLGWADNVHYVKLMPPLSSLVQSH